VIISSKRLNGLPLQSGAEYVFCAVETQVRYYSDEFHESGLFLHGEKFRIPSELLVLVYAYHAVVPI
jgi:hypothetical protein